MSFYVKPETGNTSQIKFGSYDVSATDGPMLMFKTVSDISWVIKGNSFKLGDTTFLEQERFVNMDPMVPYLYIPDADFQLVAQRIHKNFERFFQNKICDDGKCRFDKPCDQI